MTAYPLTWPPGRPRTTARKGGGFQTSLGAAVQNLQYEVKQLGGTELVISSDLPLRQDGFPLAKGVATTADVGVAAYFTLRKKPMTIACDKWQRIEHNMQAIALTIGALRGLERWGGGHLVEQAFSGFAALPNVPQWWQVLGVKSDASHAAIEAAYRILASQHHPDRGGDDAAMARINRARDQGSNQFT